MLNLADPGRRHFLPQYRVTIRTNLGRLSVTIHHQTAVNPRWNRVTQRNVSPSRTPHIHISENARGALTSPTPLNVP